MSNEKRTNIQIKHYPRQRICEDFFKVIAFLKKYGAIGFNKNWHWARWEWLLAHLSLNEATLPSIGLFMDGAEVVGLATHDMRAQAYLLVNPEYKHIKAQMLDYAYHELSNDGISQIFIDDGDMELISLAKESGYQKTNHCEHVLKLCHEESLTYNLNSQFHFTDYKIDHNINAYTEVIHRGFENEGEPIKLNESDLPERPHDNPRLALFIATSDAKYVAHCGTWYLPDTKSCYVEPVVTIPEYRKCGLGKAVVYECINRCIEMGAKEALVISNQQFYHKLGFQQYSVSHLWEKST